MMQYPLWGRTFFQKSVTLIVTKVFVNDDHGLRSSRLEYLCRLGKGLVGEMDGLPHSLGGKPTEGISLNDLLNGFT